MQSNDRSIEREDPEIDWFTDALRKALIRRQQVAYELEQDIDNRKQRGIWIESFKAAQTPGALLNVLYYEMSLNQDISHITSLFDDACNESDLSDEEWAKFQKQRHELSESYRRRYGLSSTEYNKLWRLSPTTIQHLYQKEKQSEQSEQSTNKGSFNSSDRRRLSDRIWNEGYDACMKGVRRSECPYLEELDYMAWYEGHDTASDRIYIQAQGRLLHKPTAGK